LRALEFFVVFVVLFAAVALISAPLRRPHAPADDEPAGPDTAALEAAKEAKYREIRDAELDFRTGKLSEADWREVDGTLREEAVEILGRLDAARARRSGR
jgi:hypothetical protein